MEMATRKRPFPLCGNTVSSLFEPETDTKSVKAASVLRYTRQLVIPTSIYDPSAAMAMSETGPLMLPGLIVKIPFSMKPYPALLPNHTRSSSPGSATRASVAEKSPPENWPGSVPSTMEKFSPSLDHQIPRPRNSLPPSPDPPS